MEVITFKQIKPLTVKILGAFLFAVLLILLVNYNPPMSQIVVLGLISIVLLGYSVTFTVNKKYKIKRVISLFGISIYSGAVKVFYPDYISLFSTSFKQNADWGSIAALGKEKRNVFFVVRIFKGNRHFTFFKSTSFQQAEVKAKELSALLNVEYRSRII